VREGDVVVTRPRVPVATAQPGRRDAYDDPAVGRSGIGYVAHLGPGADGIDHHCAHVPIIVALHTHAYVETTRSGSGMTDHRPTSPHKDVPDRPADGTATSLDHTVKRLESWQLLRSAVPLIAAGIGVAGLYTYFATMSDLDQFWIGVPLGLLGSALAAIGYRGRLREIRSPVPSTGRHYPWLFLGWVCVVAGLLIPPYALA
jgi:uncharacterized membrane protein YidH (DUF202 family)